jgi:hypothetical protein
MSTLDDDDSTVPDTAMASGSDAGAPGDHLGPADLLPDEQRLLAELERDVDTDDAADHSVITERAAEDDGPLPAEGGPPDDGLNPRFSSPGG